MRFAFDKKRLEFRAKFENELEMATFLEDMETKMGYQLNYFVGWD